MPDSPVFMPFSGEGTWGCESGRQAWLPHSADLWLEARPRGGERPAYLRAGSALPGARSEWTKGGAVLVRTGQCPNQQGAFVAVMVAWRTRLRPVCPRARRSKKFPEWDSYQGCGSAWLRALASRPPGVTEQVEGEGREERGSEPSGKDEWLGPVEPARPASRPSCRSPGAPSPWGTQPLGRGMAGSEQLL